MNSKSLDPQLPYMDDGLSGATRKELYFTVLNIFTPLLIATLC
jgi:hypothetical protein